MVRWVSWLSENIDELIALIIVTTFSIASLYLVFTHKVDELQTFMQSWGPFMTSIIGFYFGSKTMQRGVRTNTRASQG